MSDFDFDELDKAVAGVTGAPAAQTDNTSVHETEARPAEEVKKSPEVKQNARVVPAARRGSGRFMDVVHPSSDMRSRTSPAVVNTSGSKTETTSFVPPAITSEDDKKESTEDAGVGEWSKPLETPFLADAKVEKRPLGGFNPEPSLVLLEEPEEELKLEAPDELRLEEGVLPDPIDFAAHVASLSSEKEDTGTVIQEAVDEESVEQTVEQLEDLKQPESSIPPVLKVKTSPEPVGPTSITQQYTEQPTTEQESGAIYDTENYHQPLAPVAKKSSSVLTILGIIGLIILGAGAGVAFYFFVLPNL